MNVEVPPIAQGEREAIARRRRAESAERSRKRYPEKERARLAVKRAVKAGRLVKAEACERCQKVGPVEGSHDDYDRPLDVEWLCRQCHTAKDRLTVCRKGLHDLTLAENVLFDRNGGRMCRPCRRAYCRDWKRRDRAAKRNITQEGRP